ncbi:MAG: hypothetical protein ACM30I_16815 [Gemmatimonas sp.]
MALKGGAALVAACLAASSAASAFDRMGAFKIGAGIGAEPCREVIATIAEPAPSAGKGTSSRASAYAAYILGFQTGMNAATPRTHDVFQALGDDPVPKAFVWVKTWCETNPDSTFGAAVVALSHAVMPKS